MKPYSGDAMIAVLLLYLGIRFMGPSDDSGGEEPRRGRHLARDPAVGFIVLSCVAAIAVWPAIGTAAAYTVQAGDSLRCGSHPSPLKVVRFSPPESFYRRLAEKLGWGRPLVPMK